MIPVWAICSLAILWSVVVYVLGRRSAQERCSKDLDRLIIEARKLQELLKPSIEQEADGQ